MKKSILSLFALVCLFGAFGCATVRDCDPKAVKWFPQEVRDASPVLAKRFDLAPGVEYGYIYCTNLFGHVGDIHAVRVDLAKAEVRPFIDEGSLIADKSKRLVTTSAAAAKNQALFSVNGGFFSWKANEAKKIKDLIPYYRMKINGEVVESNAGGTLGLAFSNDGKKVKVGRVSDKELPEWENFIAGEGLVSGGKCALEWKRPEGIKTHVDAPRTLVGMDAEGRYVYVIATGGRMKGVKPSMGLSYFDSADLLMWFGCAEGINMDGGGSTTLAVRRDALSHVAPPYTPEAHDSASNPDYVILNCTSDGPERPVLDHIQFWDAKSRQP